MSTYVSVEISPATCAGIVAKHGVEHCVGHLIRDLVWMALGDGFRREEELARAHGRKATGTS